MARPSASASLALLLEIAALTYTLAIPLQAQDRPRWWLPVDTLTSGPSEDHNPAMVYRRPFYSGPGDQWLLFDRQTPSESQIAGVRLLRNTTAFDTSVIVLASRAVPDLQVKPVIGMISYYRPEGFRYRNFAAWQCFKHNKWWILASTLDDTAQAWSAPRTLVTDSLDNTDIRISNFLDSTLLVTWRRPGALMGLLINPDSTSSPLTLVAGLADSLEYDVLSAMYGSNIDLVWKEKVSGQAAFLQDAFLHKTISPDSLVPASSPDTLITGPHLANPHLCFWWSPTTLLYEAVTDGRGDLFAVRGSQYGQYPGPIGISGDTLSDNREPRSFTLPVVTKIDAGASSFAWTSDITIYEKYRGTDSMLVFLTGTAPYGQTDTVRSRGHNRNAMVSSVMIYTGSYSRTPVVWESNRTGTSHIYARMVARISGSAPEHPAVPSQPTLYQNYPNPFNPSTRISWFMPGAGVVRLAVYDVLGREVKLLLEGKQDPGPHEISFDGSGLASGVYFYRIQVRPAAGGGEFTRTRAMALIR